MKRAYISGALTGMRKDRDCRDYYCKIAGLLKDYGYESYVPHLYADPIKSPNIPAKEVWDKDHREVLSSDIIVAYVGQPSLGVGAELEIARIERKEIIIWYFKDEKVSRMALGNPAVKHKLVIKDINELLDRLKMIVQK